MCDLTNPAFTDEDKARQVIEASRWPNGSVCPYCGQSETVKTLGGKSMGPGWFHCSACRKKFTVRTGTLYERSHIPLHKWLLATHLLMSSKKGMSAHQLFRMLGFGSYKTAWFMAHRIREGMKDDGVSSGPLGGTNEPVEADETYVGGKAKNRAYKEPVPKKAVLSLIERDGRVRSFHIANVTAKTVKPIIIKNVNTASTLMTDESTIYPKIGEEFASHLTVCHSANEYARLGGFAHINTAESFFSVFKRGLVGVYHSVSEAHLHRYLAEFDFRHNNRSALGVTDGERAAKALRGIEGKRLTYRIPRHAAND
jgi:transposase-like protein